jgi:hypothetical protein
MILGKIKQSGEKKGPETHEIRDIVEMREEIKSKSCIYFAGHNRIKIARLKAHKGTPTKRADNQRISSSGGAGIMLQPQSRRRRMRLWGVGVGNHVCIPD